MKRFLLIGLFIVFPTLLYGWDPASHIYLSKNMKEIWEDFDPDFYYYLCGSGSVSTTIKKFYYLGTTLPDMFDDEEQTKIQEIINALYNVRGQIPGWILDFNYGFEITNETHNNIQTKIIFNDPPPNQNLDKLRQMVLYAKNHGWTSTEKALIYGCYVHLLEDAVAHMILQPATFGYGRSIESPELIDENLLASGEVYQEAFTPTYIPDWSWSSDILFCGVTTWGSDHYAFLQLDAVYNRAGRCEAGWQDIDYTPVQKFVEAANAVGYDVSNLSQERLESYMHGWGLTLFLLMGYKVDCSCEGGILSHPNWSPTDIANYISDIGDDAVTLFNVPIIKEVIGERLEDLLREGILSLLGFVFDYCTGDEPWTSYFESVSGYDQLWYCVPPSLRPPEYAKYRSALEYLENYSTVKKPHLRSTYSTQLDEGLSFEGFIKDMIDGQDYVWYNMEGKDIWSVARKSGLLGGMYDVLDPSYECYLQPGIFKMFFEREGNLVYTEQDIEQEIPSTIELKYDVIPFGNTRIYIEGKKEDGTWGWLVMNQIEQGYQHLVSSLPLNTQGAVNNGYTKIYFDVKTRSLEYPYLYNTMFLSDYEDAFNSTPAISQNSLYIQIFKDGDPLRVDGEDPISNPYSFWPYAINLNPVLTQLTTPSFADNYVTSYTSVHHSFIDNSEYEDYYQIYRREDSESTWQLIATIDGHSGSGDIIEYEDEGLLPRKLYHYQIKAKKGNIYSNYIYKKNFTAPNWKGTEAGDFSSHNRCHFFVDGGIHLGYYKHESHFIPIYRQLTDGKWSAPHSKMKKQGIGGNQFSLRKFTDGNIWSVLGCGGIYLLRISGDEILKIPYGLSGTLRHVSDPIHNQSKVYIAYAYEPPDTSPKSPPPSDLFYYSLSLDLSNWGLTTEGIDSFSFTNITNYSAPVLSYNGNRMIVAYSIRLPYPAGWETYLKKKSHSDTKWEDKAHIYGARFPSISDNYLCYLKEDSLYIRNLNTSEEWSTSTGSVSDPFIYYHNGLVHLAYEKNGDIIYRVFSNNRFTDGYNLSSSPDTNSVYPEVYVNNDTVYVLYIEEYVKKEIRIKTIPCITVTDVTPLTDTILTPYTTYKIRWNATIQYPAVSTKIYLTSDGGSSWKSIASLSGNPEEYNWIVRTPSNNAQFRVEVYDERGSVGIGYSHIFTIAGGGQCPLLHVYTDSGYIFDNSLLPWSEFIRKENLDRYKLSIKPASEDRILRFMITENKDITYIDNIKLLTVDHPRGVEVCVLPDGKVIAYEETNANFKAVGNHGTDYTDSVKTRGKGCWKGEKNDWLMIYKSTSNTDYIMTRGLPKRSLSLSDNDTLYTRMKPEDKIIFHPDSILKYVAIDGSARIDYVNLVRKLPARIIQKYAEVNEMPAEILRDDNEYYVINPGDSLYFSFKASPGKNKDYEREYIILTGGYYTERKGSKGPLDNKPEIKYRNEIRLVQSIGRIVLEVESEKDRTIDIKIYDVVGRKIDSKTFDMRKGIKRVGIDVHSSGVYFITTDKEILKAMVIK